MSVSGKQADLRSLICIITACMLLQVNFAVHDLNQDVLEITVFDKDLFSPNGELKDGRGQSDAGHGSYCCSKAS